MNSQLLQDQKEEAVTVVTETKKTKVYTTLFSQAAFEDTFTIYSKAKHYDELSPVPGDQHDALRRDLEALKLEVEVRPWLYLAMQMKNEGKKLLLLTDRLSLNTYKRSTYPGHSGLWDLVLCEHDMRHDQTQGVNKDYGEIKDHDGPLDVWLRNRVSHAQMRMFIKIAHAYPDVWADLSSRDGEEVKVSYRECKLTLHLPATNTYELSVAQINTSK